MTPKQIFILTLLTVANKVNSEKGEQYLTRSSVKQLTGEDLNNSEPAYLVNEEYNKTLGSTNLYTTPQTFAPPLTKINGDKRFRPNINDPQISDKYKSSSITSYAHESSIPKSTSSSSFNNSPQNGMNKVSSTSSYSGRCRDSSSGGGRGNNQNNFNANYAQKANTPGSASSSSFSCRPENGKYDGSTTSRYTQESKNGFFGPESGNYEGSSNYNYAHESNTPSTASSFSYERSAENEWSSSIPNHSYGSNMHDTESSSHNKYNPETKKYMSSSTSNHHRKSKMYDSSSSSYSKYHQGKYDHSDEKSGYQCHQKCDCPCCHNCDCSCCQCCKGHCCYCPCSSCQSSHCCCCCKPCCCCSCCPSCCCQPCQGIHYCCPKPCNYFRPVVNQPCYPRIVFHCQPSFHHNCQKTPIYFGRTFINRRYSPHQDHSSNHYIFKTVSLQNRHIYKCTPNYFPQRCYHYKTFPKMNHYSCHHPGFCRSQHQIQPHYPSRHLYKTFLSCNPNNRVPGYYSYYNNVHTNPPCIVPNTVSCR